MKKILFYIAQEYYWPSLEPIYNEFKKDENFELYIKVGKNQKRFFTIFLISQKKQIENRFKKNGYQVTSQTQGFDAVFCGAQVKNPELFGNAKLCNVDHGPGIKTLRYRHLIKQKNVNYYCFVEGKYRVEKFIKYGLDKIHEVYDTGLPKLDKFFNGYYNKKKLIEEFKIDKNKKTVLYAPSYKPTSIFMIGEQVVYLLDRYNVIVKLHPYSWSGKYASHSHHKFFEKMLGKYPNLHLVRQEEHDVMPYMFVADTMISDGSSVINEFLSLEKCGIIVDLPDDEQKHSDGKPLLEDKSSEWLEDSFIHLNPSDDLHNAVEEAINPSNERKSFIKKDKEYIFSYTDGKSAKRVKEITEGMLKK
ncbi:MAG: CDP-glycerol glycerophosphotransferase family protein [Calditrichia bacterium]|nr:CDP-glycerol glycerophosphotransferase family protein [Calditrichia bacterium]